MDNNLVTERVEAALRGRRLPDDVCRCHDKTCPERKSCLRFLQRNSGGEYVVHADTMRTGESLCRNKIE
jgi:hypothetical protein